MGFLDDVQASLNRGMASAGRAVDTQKIKLQMSDATKRRQQLAAQLGASLYERTKNDPEFRAGREGLYDGIAAVDAEIVSYQAQLSDIEQVAQQQAEAARTVECPFCHARVGVTDLFCSGCGKSMEEIKRTYEESAPVPPEAQPVAADGSVCPECGNPVSHGDAFCMACGHRLADDDAGEPVDQADQDA